MQAGRQVRAQHGSLGAGIRGCQPIGPIAGSLHPAGPPPRSLDIRTTGAGWLLPNAFVMIDPLVQQEVLVRSFIERILNQRQTQLLPDYVSLDILDYSPFILSAAHESRHFGHDVERLLTAFSDLRVTVRGMVSAPGRVAISFELSGRNTGPLPWTGGPTQRIAAWSAMALVGVAQGRISAIRGVSDRHSMLEQLGLVPTTSAA